MEEFKEGRGSVSLIPSILVGVTLGVGPIASSLVRYIFQSLGSLEA